MYYSYSNEQMRRADRETIEKGTPEMELMARAGEALAQAVKRAAKRLNIDDPLFVCGGGNNGGDGFVAAELLRKEGFSPSVLYMAEKFSPACEQAKNDFQGEVFGRPIRRRYALLVDCVLGTGLTRPPEGTARLLIELIASSGAYVISADLPSGLSSSGVAFNPCVRANETVCMGLIKNALLLEDGKDCAGKITLANIGISVTETGAEVWENGDVSKYFPSKNSRTQKGDYGAAAIVSGSVDCSGATFLAVGACLKSGAGYTKLFANEQFFWLAFGKFPACVLRKFHSINEEILSAHAVAYGMGAGVGEEVYANVKSLLSSYEGTLILDADALNSLAKYGVEILKNKKCRVVLTPHLKEFSRLINRSMQEITSDTVATCRQFARDTGVTVLLKSNSSVITDGERVAINVTGSPALAKGGSGDVLSGLLVGTIARGVSPFEACCVSSFLLGRSGELVAKEMGEYSPDGSDIIEYLPKAILSLRGSNAE